jgi:hypothetical protein
MKLLHRVYINKIILQSITVVVLMSLFVCSQSEPALDLGGSGGVSW